MEDEEYISKLENVVKQMLTPLKNIPFNLVIESLTGKRVIPFDFSDTTDRELLDALKNVALRAGKKITEVGITRARPNEVGNDIEDFIKSAMQDYNLNPDTPTGASGRKKATGYPDIVFYYNGKPHYLECKTYNLKTIGTNLRSFYFSPSEDFKVVHDTHPFIISYEMYVAGREGNRNIYKCKHWKLLSIGSLSLDVKYEFNSDNRRVYSGKDGVIILAEGEII